MSVGVLKRLLWALCVPALAAAILALVCLAGGRGRVSAHRPVHPEVRREEKAGARRLDVGKYVDPIAGREPGGEKAATVDTVAAADDPSRAFKLVSVFLVESGRKVRGFAAIVYQNEETLHSEGASLAEGYTLVMIEAESVVLEKNKRMWRLDLTGHSQKLPDEVAPIDAGKTRKDQMALDVAGHQIEGPVKSEDSSGIPVEKYEIQRKLVDETLNGLHKLLQDVRVEMDISMADGEMVGVRVYPKEGSLPHMLGLRDGDVIRAVDGRLLKGMKDVIDVFTDYQKNPPERTRLLVERNGKIVIIEIVVGGAVPKPAP